MDGWNQQETSADPLRKKTMSFMNFMRPAACRFPRGFRGWEEMNIVNEVQLQFFLVYGGVSRGSCVAQSAKDGHDAA